MAVEKQVAIIFAASKGFLDDIAADKVDEFESGLFDYLDANASDQLKAIRDEGDISDENSDALDKAISNYKNSFAV